MAHDHENCKEPDCFLGLIFGYCDYEECTSPDCTVIGHCDCKCHSGRTCDCGHKWARMEKQS